jgi:hypothetical protein
LKISGFSYVRNGFEFGYPFLESMQSVLPYVDEFVMAVGDSNDGTRQAIEQLNNPKIKIIDTVWDMSQREGGKLFATQANIALDNISGDIGFHIQADEVLHEDDAKLILQSFKELEKDDTIEGVLFDFLNFYGGYHYIGSTRKWHRREIRIIRNQKNIRSFRDSQGFRLYPSYQEWQNNHPGRPLRVLYSPIRIFHYSYARNPKLMQKKSNFFNSFWHDDNWLKKHLPKKEEFDYNQVDAVKKFEGTHPHLMREKVAQQDWEFTFDSKKSRFTPKGKILHIIENNTGLRIGEYKNYRIIKKLK